MNTVEEYEEYEEYFDFDNEEMNGYVDCPKCGRTYDEIDYEYQICSKCGWDAENRR